MEYSVAKLQKDIWGFWWHLERTAQRKKQDPNCYVDIDSNYIIPVWTSQRLEFGGMQYKCKYSFPTPASPPAFPPLCEQPCHLLCCPNQELGIQTRLLPLPSCPLPISHKSCWFYFWIVFMFIVPYIVTAIAWVHFFAISYVETIVILHSGSLSSRVCLPPTPSAYLPCCFLSGKSRPVTLVLYALHLLLDQGQTSWHAQGLSWSTSLPPSSLSSFEACFQWHKTRQFSFIPFDWTHRSLCQESLFCLIFLVNSYPPLRFSSRLYKMVGER